MVEAGVGEDKVNECGSLGTAGLSRVSNEGSQALPHTERETFRGCTCASENATEDSGRGAVAHVTCLLQGCDGLEYGCELLH